MWVVVDKKGKEYKFINKPKRCYGGSWWAFVRDSETGQEYPDGEELPYGSILEQLGYRIYWHDEPVEINV